MRTPLSVTAVSVLLIACGGQQNSGPIESPVDYDTLEPLEPSAARLVPSEGDQLADYLKNGIRLQLANGGGFAEYDSANPPPAVPEPEPVADGGSGGFSETNVHVQGVDESDYAKYDGEHWFVATFPSYNRYSGLTQPGIQVVATDPGTPNAEILAQYQLDDEWGDVSEMYLVQNQGSTSHLAAIRSQWGNVAPVLLGAPVAEPFLASDALFFPGPINSEVRVQLVDVQDAANPQEDWEVALDGSLIDSRKIGDMLYLVTRFDPWLPELDMAYGNTDVHADNESRIANAETGELMPKYRMNGNEQPLANSCYVPEDMQPNQGYNSLVSITAINLAEKSVQSSQCINANMQAIAVFPESLYLTGSLYSGSSSRTVIHKFKLGESGAEYAATGEVPGQTSARSDPAFRLHEYQKDLRIVTSDYSVRDIEHRLFVLEQDGQALEVVAQLPNANHPDPIGKPGEDIYSVRFQSERAHLVTFRRTDPLYTIDLSDRLNPVIAGELEITGFASYLHPINDRYMFTLGQDATEEGLVTGIKAELIDVAGDNPEVVSRHLFGVRGTDSEALNNLKALSFLRTDDDSLRITLPISLFEGDLPDSYGQWQYTGLQLLEVTGLTTPDAEMIDAGIIVAERADANHTYPNHGIHRGILHDDTVFYSHNNAIWAAKWDAPEDAVGPIAPPVVCDTQFVYGLQVQVQMEGEDADNVCDATVTATDGDYVETLEALGENRNGVCSFQGAGERPGEYIVEAQHPGYRGQTTRVNVTEDVCHVIPAEIYMTLTSEDQQACTEEQKPSVRIDLALAPENEDSEVWACNATVTATQRGEPYPLEAFPPPTSPDDPAPGRHFCMFQGPYELDGVMTVDIALEGFQSQRLDELMIEHDGCHVVTQDIGVTLQPL